MSAACVTIGRDMAEREWAEEAREHFERAYEEQMAGRLDAAIESYRRSIAIQPTAEAHTFLGCSAIDGLLVINRVSPQTVIPCAIPRSWRRGPRR